MKDDVIHKKELLNIADEWMDKQDILQQMRISSRTLQRWRSRGIIPYCRIGNKIYYQKTALMKLLEGNRKMNS